METLIRSIGIEKNSPQRFRDLSKADENLALVAKVKSVLEKVICREYIPHALTCVFA